MRRLLCFTAVLLLLPLLQTAADNYDLDDREPDAVFEITASNCSFDKEELVVNERDLAELVVYNRQGRHGRHLGRRIVWRWAVRCRGIPVRGGSGSSAGSACRAALRVHPAHPNRRAPVASGAQRYRARARAAPHSPPPDP